MSNTEKGSRQYAVGSRQRASDTLRGASRRQLDGPKPSNCLLPTAYCLLILACCLLFAGCRQDMQDTPRYEIYEPSTFFEDGQGSRPFVEGTVPRGERFRNADAYQYTGQQPGAGGGQAGGAQTGGTAASSQAQGAGATGGVGTAAANVQSTAQGGGQSTGDVNVRGNVAGGIPAGAQQQTQAGVGQAGAGQGATFPGPDLFPFPVTEQAVNRGQERFAVYCSMCHGPTGEGDGMIVRRGFRRPPSFHEDRLQAGNSNAAHFFDVITNGWGAMPSYADMIPWEDRWMIIAYVRALQLSRRANVNDLPPDVRGRIGAAAPAGAPAPQEGGSHR